VSRRDAREPGNYCVYIEYEDGETIQQRFRSKEENDQYAQSMELMGVKEITKSFYNPSMNQWFRYHGDGPETVAPIVSPEQPLAK
jgi:hypothetical protein